MKTSQNIWGEKWKTESLHAPTSFAKRVARFLHEQNCSNCKILDLGAGLGEDSLFFVRQGFSVLATDFAAEALDRIPLQDGLQTQLLDVTNVPPDFGRFDVIYAHLSLHYFNNPTTKETFSRLKGLLNPGGFLCVKCKSVDDTLAKTGTYEGDGLTDVKGKKYHFFSKEYMQALVEDLSVIRLRRTSSVYKHYKSAFIELIAKK